MCLLVFHLIKEGQKPAIESAAEQSGATSEIDRVRDSMTTTITTGAMSLGL